MTTTQLSLYNGALRLIGQPKLANLDEDREPRHVLDDIWDDGAREYCLEQGSWNFATRTSRIEINEDLDPDFGFINAFSKPTDWRRTITMATDEYFVFPMTDREYMMEAGFWFSDIDRLFVRYVSDDDAYGFDYSLWPQSFTKMVEAFMASKVTPTIIQNNKKISDLMEEYDKALVIARSNDALNEGVKFPPPADWNTARGGRGGRGGRRDRGRRSSLIG